MMYRVMTSTLSSLMMATGSEHVLVKLKTEKYCTVVHFSIKTEFCEQDMHIFLMLRYVSILVNDQVIPGAL